MYMDDVGQLSEHSSTIRNCLSYVYIADEGFQAETSCSH